MCGLGVPVGCRMKHAKGMFKRWLLRAGKRPWKAKKEKFHTCGGPRRRPCLGQGRGRRITGFQPLRARHACNTPIFETENLNPTLEELYKYRAHHSRLMTNLVLPIFYAVSHFRLAQVSSKWLCTHSTDSHKNMLKQHAHNMFSFHHRLKFRALPCAPLELSPGPLSRQDVNGSQLSSLWLWLSVAGMAMTTPTQPGTWSILASNSTKYIRASLSPR